MKVTTAGAGPPRDGDCSESRSSSEAMKPPSADNGTSASAAAPTSVAEGKAQPVRKPSGTKACMEEFKTCYGTVKSRPVKKKDLKTLPVPSPDTAPIVFAHDPLDPDKYTTANGSMIGHAMPWKGSNQADQERDAKAQSQHDYSSDEFDESELEDQSLADTETGKYGHGSNPATPTLANYRNSQSVANSFAGDFPRATAHRPTAVNLGEQEQLIKRMKENMCPDREISRALFDELNVKVNEKTISTRWKRIRAKLSNEAERELEAGYVEWSQETDTLLLRAYDDGDRAVEHMQSEAAEQRWKLVSKALRNMDPAAAYSAKSCQERIEAMENYAADIPQKLDDDPASRRTWIDTQKLNHQRKVAAEAEAKKEEELNKKKIKMLNARLSAAKSREEKKSKMKSGENFVSSSADASVQSPGPGTTFDFDSLEVSNNNIVDDDLDINGCKKPRVARRPGEITSLSHKGELALRAGELATEATKDEVLLEMAKIPIGLMTREEMRAELMARGHKRAGRKDALAELLAEARAGYIRASDVPPDSTKLAELLEIRKQAESKKKCTTYSMPSAATATGLSGSTPAVNPSLQQTSPLAASPSASGDAFTGKRKRQLFSSMAGTIDSSATGRPSKHRRNTSSDGAEDDDDDDGLFCSRATYYEFRDRGSTSTVERGSSNMTNSGASTDDSKFDDKSDSESVKSRFDDSGDEDFSM